MLPPFLGPITRVGRLTTSPTLALQEKMSARAMWLNSGSIPISGSWCPAWRRHHYIYEPDAGVPHVQSFLTRQPSIPIMN